MVFNLFFGQMDKVEELLPGIEDFLCRTLADENLSEDAEQKRLYFVERLDILQLPPSVPPRSTATKLGSSSPERISGSPERLQNSPERDIKSPTSIEDAEDFVAYQRELSRSLLSGNSEEELLKVKLYDDIENQQNNNSITVEAEINFYEIPVPKGTESQSHPKENDYEETTVTATSVDRDKEEMSASPIPPPLPPRRDRTASDAQSRSSCGSVLEEVKPNLPIRPQLAPKSEISKGSNEKLVEDGVCSEEYDGTSYESYEEEDSRDSSRFNVKLPKPVKKSSKQKKISKSRSSKEWDLNVPFKSLEEVTLSGELQYKGKLSWTKKLCALSEGRLVCYKPEKCDSKPALVIQLTGYTCAYSEKDNRKGFDIKLTHPSLEVHLFSVDFKEWASLWCEYINSMSEGRRPPGQYQHLARSSTFSGLESSQIYGSKADMRTSNSQASLVSSDGLEQDFVRSNSFTKGKVARMGSFASRASQFFESIGKKTGRKLSSMSNLSNLKERTSTASSLGSPCTPVTTPETPVFLPEIPCLPLPEPRKPVTHQGYLCIYSNFNKRKWGKRWCLVRDNMFECYKNETSTVCELDFLLHCCKLRRAVAETNSELGLMLVEKTGEKITVEPLSREGMCGWLKVLMNETATEKVPAGLEEFWVEEESPYHDINPRELTSPTSEFGGYSSIKEHFEYTHQKSPDLGNEDSALDISANTTLISDNQISVSPPSDSSKIHGEITGDLYSQVRRKSSSGSANEESHVKNIKAPDSIFSFDEHEIADSLERGDNSYVTEEGSMFADILNKIHRHFSRENSCANADDVHSDTAYNSAVCSENSSLERKPHPEIHSVSDNFDTLSQGTDIQVSPLEDFGPALHASDTKDIHAEGYENHVSANKIFDQSSNFMQTFDQSTRTNFEFTHTMMQKSNNLVQMFNHSETTFYSWTNEMNQTRLSVDSKSVSRDQCDSAIFESESILEDLDANPKTLSRKIEQLRTHLVELKKTRISVRNQKELAIQEIDRRNFDEEYNRLDEECRTITDEISFLEERLAL